MIRKLFPFLLVVAGLLAGLGGGLALRPTVGPEPEPTTSENTDDPAQLPEYVKMNNQFVIPVLEDGRVTSMVILSLSIEVAAGSTEQVYTREPKLRDAFLQVMFDHANSGGFRGSFTDGSNLIFLRKALLETAQSTMGLIVTGILISDIVRQDS